MGNFVITACAGAAVAVLLGASAQASIIELESNDSLATAQPLAKPVVPYADVVIASLDTANDYDIFSIDLEVGEVLSLITTPLSPFGTSPDTEIGVVGPDMTWAVMNDDAGDDNGGSEFGSAARLLAQTAGTYYVVVASFDDLSSDISVGDAYDPLLLGDDPGEVGSYVLTYSVVPVPEPASVVLAAAGAGLIGLRRRRA